MFGKKGEITTKEIVEIVLGAAAVFVLIILMYSLFVGNFDKDEETAKSYLKTLKREILVADGGGVGSFDMLSLGDTTVSFHLVYFGDKIGLKLDKDYTFRSVGNHKNHACVCYLRDGEAHCPSCEDFDSPMVFRTNVNWPIRDHEDAWKIEKNGDVYEFFQ